MHVERLGVPDSNRRRHLSRIPSKIIIKLEAQQSDWTQYQIAGFALWSDTRLARLPDVSQQTHCGPAIREAGAFLNNQLPRLRAAANQALFGEFETFVCGRMRTVQFAFGPTETVLRMEDLGTYAILWDSFAAARIDGAGIHITADQATELATGPLLIPLLAETGIFCLHGSAILTDSGAIVFVGESGAGKSTLASWLSEHLAGTTLLADDIVPLTLSRRDLILLTDFPQLKLPAERQPSVCAPRTVPVRMVAVLREDGGQIALKILTGADGATIFNSHTVAARLFHPALLSAHFGFGADAAARVPTCYLSYPREHASLPRVATHLLDHLLVPDATRCVGPRLKD